MEFSERIEIVRSRKRSDEPPGEGGTNGDNMSPLGPPPPAGPPSPPAPVASAGTALAAGEKEDTTGPWAHRGLASLFREYQGGTRDSASDAEWLKQVENLCRGALQQFQLQSKLLAGTLTPNAALLKFQGSANLTVEQVMRRRSEFLTTHKLNVISIRAEPGVVAIAIARPEPPGASSSGGVVYLASQLFRRKRQPAYRA